MEARKIDIEQSKVLPLCVDLDGTFVKTDLLWEAVLQKLLNKPLELIPLFFQLTKGKVAFKNALSDFKDFPKFPINQELHEFIKSEWQSGREIYLVTGSHQYWADQLIKGFPEFTAAYGTTDELNLTGENKAKFLTEKFGANHFDYIGDSKVDIPVWNAANKSYLVGNSKFQAEGISFEEIFQSRKSALKSLIKGMRIYQWMKGALVFAALFLSHQYTNVDLVIKSLITFFAFGFTASSVYLFNDLCDLKSDRGHPSKSKRPLASGDLPIKVGIFSLPLVVSIGLGLGFVAGGLPVVGVLSFYLGLNLLYSKVLKKIALLDVFCLSSFYGIRIWAGAVATGIVLSPWLKLFSFFLFLSLAFLKRYSEQFFLFKLHGLTETEGRDYRSSDLQMLSNLGNNSGMLSVLIFTLYQTKAEAIYGNQEILWFNTILLTYWVQRMWLKATRGDVKDDPIKFIIKDYPSLIAIGLMVVVTLLAKYMV